MVFGWSLSDSKPPQVSRTLLSILADLNIIVVWIFSTCPLISKSSCPFSNPSVTVPNTPITISITVTFILLLLLYYLSRKCRLWMLLIFHVRFCQKYLCFLTLATDIRVYFWLYPSLWNIECIFNSQWNKHATR